MNGGTSRHRLGLVAIAGLSLFGALFARLWFLQIVEGDSYDQQAIAEQTRTVIIPAPRGKILDRSGVALVSNRESIVVAVDTQAYARLEKPAQQRLLERLATTLDRNRPADQAAYTPASLTKRLNDSRFSPFRPIPVAEDISQEQEIFFSEQADRFPAVVVERQTVRDYPYGSLAAHLLGYVGALNEQEYGQLLGEKAKPYEKSDEIGKSGVEASYERFLRGTPGRRVFEVDRSNRVIRERSQDYRAPVPGDDVYLSIDAKVQYKAEEALQGRLLKARGRKTPAPAGGVTVLDPSNGQVRAMASFPTYDPRQLVGGISCPVWRDLQGLPAEGTCQDVNAEIAALPVRERPASKLINRALAGAYPPASTFKLATSYAALKLGIITPQASISDPGFYRLCTTGNGPGCVKRNAGGQSYGSVDLQKALTVSSDVYFYRIGHLFWSQASNGSLAKTGLQDHIGELGYGARTGIDLPGESAGNVPTPQSEAEVAAALFKSDPARYDNDEAKAISAGRWRTGYSADLSIGQKVDATPLQTANAYAALANGGTLYQPQVLDRVQRAGSKTVIKAFEAKVIRTIDWGGARDAYIEGFTGAVASESPKGTAYNVFNGFPLTTWPVAGKTGTAQTGLDENEKQRPENSLFVGFDLAGGSRWVASAMLEGAGAGSNAAAPTVRMIFEPIATGEIDGFEIPRGGRIDAEAVAAETAGISTVGSD